MIVLRNEVTWCHKEPTDSCLEDNPVNAVSYFNFDTAQRKQTIEARDSLKNTLVFSFDFW